jgi:L-fuconolactonase
MSPERIVDSHVHLWNPAQLRYPWLDGLPALNRAFLQADFAAASGTVNVEKLLFVECGCESVQSLAEVDWVSSLAKGEPRLKGVVAHAPMEKGEAVRAELELLGGRPLVKGVRRSLQDERDPGFCLRPDFISAVKLLAEFDFTFDLCVRHGQLPGVVELVRRVPQVTFVLDHFGKPEVRGGKMEPWATAVKAIAALPNVACKLSGLATEADWQNWQPDALRPFFERALECFGFDRVLFGSDWPVATLATSYQRWYETARDLVAFARNADRLKLFRTNAERIYRV